MYYYPIDAEIILVEPTKIFKKFKEIKGKFPILCTL